MCSGFGQEGAQIICPERNFPERGKGPLLIQ